MKTTLKNVYNEPSRGPVTWLTRQHRLNHLSSIAGTHSGRRGPAPESCPLTPTSMNPSPGDQSVTATRSWQYKTTALFLHVKACCLV